MGRHLTLDAERLEHLRTRDERRLVRLFETLMTAAEAMRGAADFAAVEKQAKALSAVRRTLNDVYGPRPDEAGADSGEMDMNDGQSSDGLPKYDALDAWQRILERKLDRRAERLAKTAVDRTARPDDGADSGDGLGVLGQ